MYYSFRKKLCRYDIVIKSNTNFKIQYKIDEHKMVFKK